MDYLGPALFELAAIVIAALVAGLRGGRRRRRLEDESVRLDQGRRWWWRLGVMPRQVDDIGRSGPQLSGVISVTIYSVTLSVRPPCASASTGPSVGSPASNILTGKHS
jgi:hypothetical protein